MVSNTSGFYVFNVFFQNPKKRDFLRFLLCCIRFLEQWLPMTLWGRRSCRVSSETILYVATTNTIFGHMMPPSLHLFDIRCKCFPYRHLTQCVLWNLWIHSLGVSTCLSLWQHWLTSVRIFCSNLSYLAPSAVFEFRPNNYDFRPISRFISQMMQERAIVTIEGE